MSASKVLFLLGNLGGAAGQCYRKDLAPEHKPEYVKTALPHTYTQASDLPAEFTWQNVNGKSMLTPLLNQHIPVYCGGCWLHGSTAVLNDRLNIARKGKTPQIMLARQVVLNCGTNESSDHYAGSCQGGTDKGVYNYMMKVGLPDETCQQYDATDHECSPLRTCMNCDNKASLKPGQDMCYPVTRYGKFFAQEWGPVTGVDNMKAEIFRRGPITCGVDSSRLEEGRYHRGEIIADLVRPQDGKAWEADHVISIVGWGAAQGEEYWIVRNSWGRYWGEDGFVKIATGKNVMNIEADCNWVVIGADPVTDIFGPSDADRLFPSADVSTLDAEGYAQALASKFQYLDVATFIRRLNATQGFGLEYNSDTIKNIAEHPPATFAGLIDAIKTAPASPRTFHGQPLIVVAVAGSVAAGLAILLGATVCIVGRRRLFGRRSREVSRVGLTDEQATEVA